MRVSTTTLLECGVMSTFDYKDMAEFEEQQNKAYTTIDEPLRVEGSVLGEDVKRFVEKYSGGIKHDQEKPRMDLLSSLWVEGVAKVLTFGAKKYAGHNWRKGIVISRSIAAALRHIYSFNDGQDNDPETGLSHLYHASCCLMFAAETLVDKPELDDRYKRGVYDANKEFTSDPDEP